MSRHQDLINALRAAEAVIVNYDEEIEGDFKPVMDGYKVLRLRFEKEFGRPWTPTKRYTEWLTEKETS